MENKKDFKILCVGEGGEGKKKIEYNPIYLYSQNLNFIRPFDEAYRKINEKAFEEIKELIPTYRGKKTLYTINPEHGDRIVDVDQFNLETESIKIGDIKLIRPTQKCDALITEYDFGLSIFPADCQCVAIKDNRKSIKALVHSGWRGTLKEVIPKTILELLLRGSKIQDIQVVLGPMLLKQNFEIKDDYINDFREYIKELGAEKKIISYNIAKDCYNIDLLEIILKQLKNIGILEGNINLSSVEDTYSSVDEYGNIKYHSYRRDKNEFRNICVFI